MASRFGSVASASQRTVVSFGQRAKRNCEHVRSSLRTQANTCFRLHNDNHHRAAASDVSTSKGRGPLLRVHGFVMPSCEKCWSDACGVPDRYNELIEERKQNPCTPEQQAGGEYAGECERCGRKTVHCVVGRCVNPECAVEA